jgi:HAD superfamily hydrolase (TIGR01509 family)
MSLVIFDCDGVLVESEAIYLAAELEFLADAGLTFDRSDYMRQFMGLPPDVWEQRLAEVITEQKGDKPEEGFFDKLQAFTTRRLRQELVPVKGARAAIESIEMPRCGASSSSPEALQWKLKHTDLIDLFEPNLFSTQLVENGKPAPDLFLLAADRMGVPPSECVVIEDSSNGVRAGRSAGMKTIGFTAGSHCLDDHGVSLLADGADVIVDSYEMLPAAIGQL